IPHPFASGDLLGVATSHGDSRSAPSAIVTTIESSVVLDALPAGGLVSYGNTFSLHSLPTSSYKVYLDFDGYTTTGLIWNSYWNTPSFYSKAFSLDGNETFNSAELLSIQQIWQRVAEYYSPFNIDVTTEDPGIDALRYTGSRDTSYGIHVVITDEDGKNYGGLSFNGSFNWNTDTPAYIYANRLSDNAKYIADAAAHEVGHTLGLNHDGRSGSEYYYGHGSGNASWAPLMGVGYYDSVVQFSNGGYNGATNTEDDLAIITSKNGGVTYRADDWGGTFANAGALGGTVTNGVATVQTYGIISGSGSRNDVDMFSFTLGAGGSVNLTVSAGTAAFVTGSSSPVITTASPGMLDVGLTLYDSAGQVVTTVNDVTRTTATLALNNLQGGTYYLAVDGVGWGDPMASTPTGWSDYGSLGQYLIRGTYTAVRPQVMADHSSYSLTEGGSIAITYTATNATSDILLSLSGAPVGTSLSASQLTLSAANNWTASVTLASIEDRDAAGNKAFTLLASSGGVAPNLSTAGTLLDNDIAPASGGNTYGTYTIAPTVSNATVSSIAMDNLGASTTDVLTLGEGMTTAGATIDYRWTFTNLTAGDKLLQVDAWSGGEAFRLVYSTDDAVTWKAFDAPDAPAWKGSYLATGVGSSLWVKLVDTSITDDATVDTVTVDLLTLTNAPAGQTDLWHAA
ncbi:zinc-dependent metalloprotease family protein, partial [Paracraurococcus lichenis]